MKITKLQNAFQTLSYTVMDSDFAKGVVDFATDAVTSIDTLIDSIGALGTAIAGLSLYQGFKGSG